MLQQDEWDRIPDEDKKEWLGNPLTLAYLRRLRVDASAGERTLVEHAETGDASTPAFAAHTLRTAGMVRGLKLAIRYAGVSDGR